MDKYNHFAFCEEMARRLTYVQHTDEQQRYFKALGLERYSELDDRLSSVTGPILIAIDSGESSTDPQGGENLPLRSKYHFIIATNTEDGRHETIERAIADTRPQCWEVMCVLWKRYPTASRKVNFYSAGPIGDNYYGTLVEFTFDEWPSYEPDSSFFL